MHETGNRDPLQIIMPWYDFSGNANLVVAKKGGMQISFETKTQGLKEIVKNRKTHTIEFMKQSGGIDDVTAGQAYNLAGKIGRCAFITFLFFAILGSLFNGNFGILHTVEMAVTSFLWALLFYTIVIIMGEQALILEGEIKTAWQKIK